MQTPTTRYAQPSDGVFGQCHWEYREEGGLRMAHLTDEAGVIWQTQWRDAPPDNWAGSVQRHESMGDAQ